MVLLSQMEIFSNIESRIEGAVQRGDDSVVQALDREIDPLLDEILHYRPRDPNELHRQLSFITDLIQRCPEDSARVMRLTKHLKEKMQDYFLTVSPSSQESLAKDLAPSIDTALRDQQRVLSQAEIARVAVISSEYRFLYCNGRLAEDFLYKPGLLAGRSILEFCNRAVFDADYRSHLDMCLAGALREFRAANLTGGDGAAQMRVRLTPVRNIERRISGAVMVLSRLDACA